MRKLSCEDNQAHTAQPKRFVQVEMLRCDHAIRSSIVLNSCFSTPEVEMAEEEWGLASPLNQIAKLHLLTRMTKTPAQLTWTLRSIIDGVRAGLYTHGSFSFTAMKGDGNNKGVIEVMCKKLDMKNHLLTEFLDSKGLGSAVRSKIREAFADHDSYRKHAGFPTDDQPADLSWQTSWPTPAMQVARLVEEAVYGQELSGMQNAQTRNTISKC